MLSENLHTAHYSLLLKTRTRFFPVNLITHFFNEKINCLKREYRSGPKCCLFILGKAIKTEHNFQAGVLRVVSAPGLLVMIPN